MRVIRSRGAHAAEPRGRARAVLHHNLVILEDDSGHRHRRGAGSEARRALERSIPLVVGSEIGRYRTLDTIRGSITGHQVTSAAEAAVLKQPHEINLRMDNVPPRSRPRSSISSASISACRCAGSWRRTPRNQCVLAYLFYIGDRTRTDLDYLASSGTGGLVRRAPRRR
jgi:glucarate dehydratase